VTNKATYLLLWYFREVELIKKINIAPIIGNNISEESIGISINLLLRKLTKL
tara:strand:+ start:251 stop:406 length:156 start_codon:yes stop_codon:yes gene_type:complete